MPAAYAEADIFCLPSWWEAMPLSILEAMASSLPVVATDVGDVSREVEDGNTGFVVPVRSPDQLAAALAKLLTPEQAEQPGPFAVPRVGEYCGSGVATLRTKCARPYLRMRTSLRRNAAEPLSRLVHRS